MKKNLILVAACLALAACGNKNKADEKTEGAPGDETATETLATPKEDAYILDPAKDDLSKPITTTQLIHSMSAYYGKTIQMVVYPTVYVDGEKCKQDMYGTATPDGSDKAVTMNFTSVPDLAITKGKPYLLKGKITEIGYWGELKVVEAELSPIEGEAKTTPFNVKAISGDVVYNTQDIINSIKAWDKKVVTVTGDYMGTTTSWDSKDKKKLLEERVDLQTNGDPVRVGCSFQQAGEAGLEASSREVSIQGEVDYMFHYDAPYLMNCKVINKGHQPNY